MPTATVPAWFKRDVYYQNKLASLGEGWSQSSLDAAFLGVGYTLDAEGMYRHFVDYGNGEGISPNSLFDTRQYLRKKTADFFDVETPTAEQVAEVAYLISAAGMTPWSHYCQHGWREGINPSDAFDTDRYFADKLAQLGENWSWDMMIQAFVDSGLDPIAHFYAYGMGEGLSAKSVVFSEPTTPTEPTTPVVNTEPVIDRIPSYQSIGVGVASALADFTVFDADGDNLTVTLVATNGTLGGVTDADPATTGTQLKGSASTINAALKNLTFTATTIGNASIGIIVFDGTATTNIIHYTLTVKNSVTVDDDISGGTGNDTLNVTGTVNYLYGGDGNDTITVKNKGAVSYLYGDDGNDTITIEIYGSVRENLHGDAGNDTIENSGSVYRIWGDEGDDTITIKEGGTITYIYGGADNDIITIESGVRTIIMNIYGGADNDIITIKSGATVTCSSSSPSYGGIQGGGGNDIITIESGATVQGSDYSIDGGNGDDIITVAGTVKSIYGGKGNDTITIESGGTVSGSIYGGEGADIITVESGATVNRVVGGYGADIIKLNNQAIRIYISDSDTGGYAVLEAGTTAFSLAGIDQIHSPGSGTTLALIGSWSWRGGNTTLTRNTTFVGVSNNTIQWIQGTVNAVDNTFTANSNGTDALVIYDTTMTSWTAEPITPHAVALVGVDPSCEFFATDGGMKII